MHTTILSLIRPFPPRQQQIAELIAATSRRLTMAEIAGKLARLDGRPVSVHTVRSHIRAMALLVDGAHDMQAYEAVCKFIQYQHWEKERAARAIATTG